MLLNALGDDGTSVLKKSYHGGLKDAIGLLFHFPKIQNLGLPSRLSSGRTFLPVPLIPVMPIPTISSSITIPVTLLFSLPFPVLLFLLPFFVPLVPVSFFRSRST